MVKPVVRTKTGAKVTLTLELTNLGSWGLNAKLTRYTNKHWIKPPASWDGF